MNLAYLESAKKQFEYYKMLGDKTIAQLQDNQLFWHYNDQSNSIATIVKHLSGNMLSRWTDFLTTDGEKEWRNRDEEFNNAIKTKTELLQKWNEGWNCLFEALNSLQEDDFSKTIYIRNQGHSITEAINRQLAHYPYHVGQMVYVGKMICNQNWVSLSIPKGNSSSYNAEKFSKEKHNEHFTNEYLNNQNTSNKTQIIDKLTTEHAAFWETALLLPNATIAVNGKWSVAQNVVHITMILTRINTLLSLPKSSIETSFGFSNRKSIAYDDFVKSYLNALKKGVKAPDLFIPDSNLETDITELVAEAKKALQIFIQNLENWTEDDLENYNCPHPALGTITVREMLYFTIYHVGHHHLIIKRDH